MAPQAQAVSLSNQMDSPSSSGDGYVVAQAGSKLGFFGATPVAQPSGNDQLAITRGAAGGVVTTYHSAQSPSAVTINTTAEQTLTIQTGTGGQMLLASGDLLYVNKPTAQAGLSVGNVRVSSGNTLGITFGNATGSSLTPTASENYIVFRLCRRRFLPQRWRQILQ